VSEPERQQDDPLVLTALHFVKLTAEKKRVGAELKEINEELDKLQEPLIEGMLSGGLQKITTRGGATVYVAREVSVALVAPDGMTPDEARLACVKLLEQLGHERVITYNHQAVAAIVRELAGDDEDLEVPAPLGRYLRAEPRFRVKATGVQPAAQPVAGA